MAVNLKATATLNTKPYMASLKRLGAETAKLNTTAVRGSKAVVDAQERETAARERGAQRVLNNTRTMTNSARQVSRSMQQVDRSTAAYGETLGKVNRLSADNIETMSRMTQRQIALRNASESLRVARQRLADVESVSRAAGDPTALNAQRALTRADTAYTKALNARRAEVYANQELAKSERLRAQAMVNGTDAAAKQAQSFKNLSNETLNLQRAKDRLAIAEARLASAYTTSNGVLTPAVATARRELASAQIGYNNLAAAQESIAKSGPRAASGLAAQRYLLHDLSRQLTMTGVLMAALPAAMLTTAAVWERRFADVVRTADPAFSSMDNRVNALRTSLVGMAQAMPTSFGDITEIATLANQMGIAASQTADFTRAVAMFTATSGVSVDVAASAFGRLTSILGDSSIGFMEMSDSILKVGVNSVATEDEIINVTTQISSIAAQAGFSAKEMIGLSGALASVRVPPELSRGVVTRVFGQIDKAVNAGGTGLESLARISGTSAEQFRKDWGTEQSASLFNNFLRGLRDAGSAARSELNALGITSVRDVPVMLRIANAADSEGNVGELLTQTMRDAHAAAGETQRQYEIMAETVVGKLKILGNNILAFFDAAGQSGLGVFGDLLDKATKGIRDLTRSLDDPHAIFGIFGQTNADVMGWAISIGLAVSAVTLLAAGLTKVAAGVRAVQHFSAIAGLTGGGAAAKGGGLMAIAAGGKQAAGAAGLLRGGLGRVASFMMGPWGLAIAGGAAVLGVLNTKMKENATDSGALATSLASIDTSNIVSLNNELSKITVPGPSEFLGWEMDTKPFENGISGFQDALDSVIKTRNANQYDWFGGKQTFELGQWVDRTAFGKWDEIEGIKVLDESIQNLVDSGNTPKAAKMLTTLARSGEDLTNWMSLDEGKNVKAFLENAFDLAGIEMTEDNLNRFARGTLPELTDGLIGLEGISLNADQLFEGDFERLGQFAQVIDEGAASFLNLGSAMEEATTVDADGMFESFDLTKWTEALNAQVAAQQNWSSNLSEIAKHTTPEVVESLAELGEAGQHGVQALAEGLRKGTPEAMASLEALEAQAREGAAGFGNSLAEELANIDWARGLLKNNELSDALLSNFGQDALSRVREAGVGVGQEALRGIVESLAKGDIDLETAIHQLKLSQDLVRISPTFDTEELDKGLVALAHKLDKETGFKTNLQLEINTETTVGDLRQFIDDPELNSMDIDADLTLAEAYAESRAFQVWAESQGIDIYLGANDTPAKLTLAAMLALADGSIAEVQLNALPTLAENEIYQIVQTADGVTAFVKVDGENGDALESVAYVVDEAGNTIATIPLSADDKEAISKVDGVGEHASRTPAKIAVNAEDYASSVIDHIARDRTSTVRVNVISQKALDYGIEDGKRFTQANGGVVSYYADGGMRENHVAQIAPAGSWRVWAEPETGGEAYIPLSKTKRARSLNILDEVASRFGYALQPQNYTKYADGGQYMAQAMSRQRVAASTSRGVGGDSKVNIGSVNFEQANQTDQFREFSRHMNRIARGL